MTIFNCVFCDTENQSKGSQYYNKYCDRKCQGLHKIQIWFETHEEDFINGLLKSRASIKRFILRRDGNCCSICNQLSIHNNKLLTMVLDHIDGDASNNNPINFRLVCPSCNSQLSTFAARNIGNGRATKGMAWNS